MNRTDVTIRAQMVMTLEALYDLIPEVQCKRKCGAACSIIAMSSEERLRMELRMKPERLGVRDGLICSALRDGACSIYEYRPVICRLYGAVEDLRCDYGCTPPSGLLSAPEAQAIMNASVRLGGQPRTNME